MPIRDYCRREPSTARPDESIRDAAKRMDAVGVGCLVIVDGEGRPAGIVTDRDVALRVLRKRLDADATPVREIMNKPVVTVTADAPVAVALRLMRTHALRRLPVVESRGGRLIGIVTCDDMLDLISTELAAAADAVRGQMPQASAPGAGGR